MQKVEWDNLEIVEEFPAIDPNNKAEIFKNNESLDIIAAIILRAHQRTLIYQQRKPETADKGAV